MAKLTTLGTMSYGKSITVITLDPSMRIVFVERARRNGTTLSNEIGKALQAQLVAESARA